MSLLRKYTFPDPRLRDMATELYQMLTAATGGLRWNDNIAPLITFRYAAGTSTTLVLDPSAGFQTSAAGAVRWTDRAGIGLASLVNNAYHPIFIGSHTQIPAGATVTRIKALVRPAVAEGVVANRMKLDCSYATPNFATPADPTETAVFSTVSDDGTANVQVLDSGALTLSITDESIFEIGLSSSHDGAANRDAYIALQITYDDPDAADRDVIHVATKNAAQPLAVLCLRAVKRDDPSSTESGARVTWSHSGTTIRIHEIDLSSATDEYDVHLGVLYG
jgi:hypothetical protein